jgi:phage tail-like protein
MGLTIDTLMAVLEVDSASLLAVGDDFVVVRRDPEPSETGIDLHTEVLFTVVDLNGDPAAPAYLPIDFTLNVDGVLAATYTGGALTVEAGWDPALSSVTPTTSVDAYVGFAVRLVQLTDRFVSEQVVSVALELTVSGEWTPLPWGSGVWVTAVAPYDVSTSWSFTIEDLTPPKLLTAVPRSPMVLRVVFDDGMTLGTGTECADDPTNWTITRHNVDPLPGVALAVVSAEVVTGSLDKEFDLTFDWEQTPGCEYHAHVAGTVEDGSGNTMDAAFCIASWTGFQPEIPEGRVWDLWRFVPRKIRTRDDTKDLRRLINCWQELVNLMLREVDRMTDIFDPDLCDDATIEAMLYDLGNPFVWTDLELTALQRRKLVRYLVPIYKLKGTAVGIESVVLFLLGKIVHVRDYLHTGWRLGISRLGDGGGIALIKGEQAAWPMNLAALLPLNLSVEIDDGVVQVITIVAGDFVNPAAATAQEVAAAIDAHIAGGTAGVLADGSPAAALTGIGPFAIMAGDNLLVEIEGHGVHEAIFQAGDFVSAGSVTVDEVALRLAADLPDAQVGVREDYLGVARCRIASHLWGAASSVTISGGTAQAKLGVASAVGLDGENICLYSDNAEVGASIAVSSSLAADTFGFVGTNASAARGGCVLGLDDEHGMYSFDIETDSVLTSDEEAIVRKITEYMKPAHTHLMNIRAAKTLPLPTVWTLGWSHLGVDTTLTE